MSLSTALSDPTLRSIVIADAIKEPEAELDEQSGKVIAHDLLGVTDARMSQSSNKVAKTFYEKLRPRTTDQVVDGMPRLARLVVKHS